ncbi:hypothetical protein [Thioalkalivibrio sp. ALE19]|uniref:hypothetical protein n=1 Tax=Thioalkalivibrio sp. ALE19 TaxID=1266909 RepID=UPI00041E1527|nr:hypothetical protein [Thioalkalivibrio sp. ALE19]
MKHASSDVIPLRDDHNDRDFFYKKVSARLPEFWEKYPPQAYSLTTEVKQDPVGEPGFAMVEARLVSVDGRVIANGYARSPLSIHKDLEALETSAVQRVLARLGFGGEVLDDDEARDQSKQGLSQATGGVAPDAGGNSTPKEAEPAPVQSAPQAGKPPKEPMAVFPEDDGETDTVEETEEAEESAFAENESVEVYPVTSQPESDSGEDAGEAAAESAPVAETDGEPETVEPTADSEPLPSSEMDEKEARKLERLVAQLHQVARQAGKEPPEVSTIQEARDAIRQLHKER